MSSNGKSPSSSLSVSQTLLSYQSLYESVDLPPCPSSVSPESLERILQSRISQLNSCGDPFKRPSQESGKLVESGTVKAQNGEQIKLEAGEKELVQKISSRFDLDQVESFLLLRSFLRSDDAASLSLPPPPPSKITATPTAAAATGGPSSVVEQPSPSKATSSLSADLLDHFNLFYFRERLAILRLVAALLRAVEDERHEYFEVAQIIIPQLLARPSFSPDAPPSFVQRLARQFDTHTRTLLPNHIISSTTHSPLWAKQLLKEQLSILLVLFLVLYNSSSETAQNDPDTVEGIIAVLHRTDYGRNQRNVRFLKDQESEILGGNINGMVVIICVEVLDLETLLSIPLNTPLFSSLPPNSLLSSPAHLLRLHHHFLTVVPSPTTSPILVAWSYILSRLTDSLSNETPEEYIPLAEAILPSGDGQSQQQQPAWQTIVTGALGGQGNLLGGLSHLLRGRLFVDVEDGGEGGGGENVDLNALGYRSVMKGLMSCLTELVRVEFLPFEAMVDCWIALYGSGTGTASLCHQFWDVDFPTSPTRRSLLVLARSRFPTLLRPLIQLSRSLCGDESLSLSETFEPSETSAECADIVFRFFAEIPSLSHVLPSNTRGKSVVEPGMQPGEIQYRTQRRLDFPAGIVVPNGTVGIVVSPPKTTPVVVSWGTQVSGWRLSLDILRAFVGIRVKAPPGSRGGADEDVFGAGSGGREPSMVVSLEEMGIEDCAGEDAILDILDLFKSVLSSGPSLAAELVAHLSPSDSLSSSTSSQQNDEDSSSTDIVQILFSILERSLSSSTRPTPTSSRLISTTLSVLTSLLPAFPGRVWTYLRSSSLLFSNGRSSASTSSILASERSIGSYPTTIALVDLVFALFLEAQRSHFVVEQEFLQVKADVLTRALSLIHAEIWTGYTGWKYKSLKERFEIGKKVTTLYDEILRDPTLSPRTRSSSSSSTNLGPLSTLQSFFADAFIVNSTNLALASIVSTLVIGRGLVAGLYASGRVFEAPRAERLIEGTLRFVRHLLATKRRLDLGKLVPLEQLFFDRSSSNRSAGNLGNNQSRNGNDRVKTQIVDVVANFVTSPSSSQEIAREAVLLLETLSGSLSVLPGSSPPSIVGHLEDATATTQAFLDLLADPYQDRDLRRSVWNFLGVLMSTQLGWAALFLDMKSHSYGGGVLTSSSSRKGKEKEGSTKKEVNAITLAQTMVVLWEEYWESDPAFLSSILRFLDVAWENFGDHKALAALRSDPSFWEPLFGITFRSKLSPSEPDLDSDLLSPSDPNQLDDDTLLYDQDTRVTSYRNLSRAYAIHLFALDLETTGRRGGGMGGGGGIKTRNPKPASFEMVEKLMLRQKHRLMGGASSRYLRSSCDPELHETVHRSIREAYPGFEVESVRLRLPREERDFGEGYLYSIDVLRQKIEGYRSDQVDNLLIDQTVEEVQSINLDWSFIDSEVACTKAWRQLLTAIVPLFLDGSVKRAEILLRDVRTIAPVIARETRDGDVMLAVHVERMEILRTLVEGTWGTSIMEGSSSSGSKGKAPVSDSSSSQLESFIGVLPEIRNLIISETFPPLDSLRGAFSVPFHQTLLQILFLFVRKAVDLPSPSSSNPISPQDRLVVHSFLQTTLRFLVLALGSTFERILQTQSSELDGELSLLVAVFEQAVRPEHNLSPSEWLSLADEIGLVRNSLDVVVSSPWSTSAPSADASMTEEGEEEGEGGVQPRRPLFMEQTLNFHLAISTIDRGADRLISSAIMAAYSTNVLAEVAQVGQISPTIKDAFGGAGGHDPLHAAWLAELGVVVNLIGSIGSSSQFVGNEVVPWVQLCGHQFTHCFEWRSGQPITSAQLQELDSISTLFFSIATSLQSTSRFTRTIPIVRAFAGRARLVLQLVNDLLSHPNHLFALIEPVTDEERFALHKESSEADASSLEPDALPNPAKRPFLCAVIQRLFLIARTLTFNINMATRSTSWLVNPDGGDVEDLMIAADATVSASEPATIGTLLEIAEAAISYNLQISSRPPQAPTSVFPDAFTSTSHLYLPPYSPSISLPATRDVFEAVSLLAVTQLALATRFSSSKGRMDQDRLGSSGGRGGEMDRLAELAQDVGQMVSKGEAKTKGDDGGKFAVLLQRHLARAVQ